MYVEYISNKNGYSGSLYINDLYFVTFYFILKWVKARKLPHFIFIMLSCFKMVVATPSNGKCFFGNWNMFQNIAKES
jgi:hypothetical protein